MSDEPIPNGDCSEDKKKDFFFSEEPIPNGDCSEEPIPNGDCSEEKKNTFFFSVAVGGRPRSADKKKHFFLAQPWALALQITKSALLVEIFIWFASLSFFTSLANNGI